MPLSRDEKIVIAGVGGGLALLGIAALVKRSAPTGRALTPLVSSVSTDLIPPYVNDPGTTSATVLKQTGNEAGPAILFAGTMPELALPNLKAVANNPTGTPTKGYAYLKIDLTQFQPAKIVLTKISAYVADNGSWSTFTGRLNLWDQNGVSDPNWFTPPSGTTGFIVGTDLTLPPTPNHPNLESAAVNIDISSKTALYIEPAFSGVPVPGLEADAWIGPWEVNITITPLVTVQVNITTDGGVLLTNSASVTVKNSLGVTVATGTTTTGKISFPNLSADAFTVTVVVGTRTVALTETINTGTGIFTFSFLHPVATFTVSPSGLVPAGATVILDPTGTTDPQGSIVSQTWLVQSGTSTILNETLTPGNTSFLKAISYVTPAGTATETITMTVTNDAGLTSSVQKTEQVVGTGVMNVTVTDDHGNLYQNVEVDIYDSTNALVAKQFSLSNGIATFSLGPGTYTAKASLALNGAPGITKSTSFTIAAGQTVSASLSWNHPTCSFSFATKPNVTDVGASVTVQATASSGESDPAISFGSYDWGDGTSNNTTNTGNLLSIATHVYTGTTSTHILLTVLNDAGLSATATQAILVNPALSAIITVSANPIAGTTTIFEVTLSGGTPGYQFIQFDFGDGNKTVIGTPPPYEHVYANPGNYTTIASFSDQVELSSATAPITVGSAITAWDSRLYPATIIYQPALGTIGLTGVLSLNGNALANGINDIINTTIVNGAYNSVPGGSSGLYDIGEDMTDAGIINIIDIGVTNSRYNRRVSAQYLNGQVVTVEAYSTSKGWIVLGSVVTAPGVIPFRSGTAAQTLNAQGIFQFNASGVPSDLTQVRFDFGGNAGLLASTSPGYGILQAFR